MPKEAADDPEEVERAFVKVAAAMQEALDELRASGRHGLFPRGKQLRRLLAPFSS